VTGGGRTGRGSSGLLCGEEEQRQEGQGLGQC
jgi:hypothetical protein